MGKCKKKQREWVRRDLTPGRALEKEKREPPLHHDSFTRAAFNSTILSVLSVFLSLASFGGNFREISSDTGQDLRTRMGYREKRTRLPSETKLPETLRSVKASRTPRIPIITLRYSNKKNSYFIPFPSRAGKHRASFTRICKYVFCCIGLSKYATSLA